MHQDLLQAWIIETARIAANHSGYRIARTGAVVYRDGTCCLVGAMAKWHNGTVRRVVGSECYDGMVAGFEGYRWDDITAHVEFHRGVAIGRAAAEALIN